MVWRLSLLAARPFKFFFISTAVFWTFLLGCDASAANPVSFEKKKIKVGQVSLTVEMAETPEQQQRGLMFRKSLGEGEGMLFIFPEERPLSFWMKNTFVDLSIGFFDSKKKLVDIQDMKAVSSMMEENPPNYVSRKPAKYALEVPQGWFKRKKIKIGDSLHLL